MSQASADEVGRIFAAAMQRRDENGGRHLHTSACIHNLSPEEQIALRGCTVDWWMQIIGKMPVQITPGQWEAEPL